MVIKTGDTRPALRTTSVIGADADAGEDAEVTMTNSEATATAEIIENPTKTWQFLLGYDERRLGLESLALARVDGMTTPAFDHDLALALIAKQKRLLMDMGEASSLFGLPRGDALAAILGNLDQTCFGEPLYPTVEERAAHLLYFVVKDHPFVDGNKRIATQLFLRYLRRERVKHRLDALHLATLTLFVATSQPADKDIVVRLIVNLLAA